MRVYLNVPFPEKDIAKGLGARWDGEKKKWYIENKKNLCPFLRWMDGHLVKRVGTPQKRGRRKKKNKWDKFTDKNSITNRNLSKKALKRVQMRER